MKRQILSSPKAQYLAHAQEALQLAELVSFEADKERLRRSAEYWTRRAEGLTAVEPGGAPGDGGLSPA
jgi:hypothetical protein